MNKFLQECQKVYQTLLLDPARYKTVRVILGNESCDLDSAISALVYGYIIYHENKQKGIRNSEVLPLLNIEHEDLPLKTEVTFYLKLHGISLENVPTRGSRDLFSLSKLHKAGVLQLTLVDHHMLPVRDQELMPSVVEIIDHRPQEPDWDWPNVDVTIKPVGSCATLIAKKILQRSPHLLTFQICHLLYGPILLDTFNFSAEAGRTTDLDKQVISSLEKKISVDRVRLFQDLVFAKTQVNGLSDSQILRKDLKIIGGIPIAGLPFLVDDFVKRADIEQTLLSFLRGRNNVPVMMLMGVKISGEAIEKDMAIFAINPSAGEKIIEALLKYDAPSLELKEIEHNLSKFLKIFKQSNVRMSRKQVAPIIQKATSSINEIIKCGLGGNGNQT